MTHSSPLSAVANDDIEAQLPAEAETNRALSKWFVPLEVVAALLMVVIVVLLLGGVVSRYVFRSPTRLDRRGRVDRVPLGGDDRRCDRDASQRAPAADAGP